MVAEETVAGVAGDLAAVMAEVAKVEVLAVVREEEGLVAGTAGDEAVDRVEVEKGEAEGAEWQVVARVVAELVAAEKEAVAWVAGQAVGKAKVAREVVVRAVAALQELVGWEEARMEVEAGARGAETWAEYRVVVASKAGGARSRRPEQAAVGVAVQRVEVAECLVVASEESPVEELTAESVAVMLVAGSVEEAMAEALKAGGLGVLMAAVKMEAGVKVGSLVVASAGVHLEGAVERQEGEAVAGTVAPAARP